MVSKSCNFKIKLKKKKQKTKNKNKTELFCHMYHFGQIILHSGPLFIYLFIFHLASQMSFFLMEKNNLVRLE